MNLIYWFWGDITIFEPISGIKKLIVNPVLPWRSAKNLAVKTLWSNFMGKIISSLNKRSILAFITNTVTAWQIRRLHWHGRGVLPNSIDEEDIRSTSEIKHNSSFQDAAWEVPVDPRSWTRYEACSTKTRSGRTVYRSSSLNYAQQLLLLTPTTLLNK